MTVYCGLRLYEFLICQSDANKRSATSQSICTDISHPPQQHCGANYVAEQQCCAAEEEREETGTMRSLWKSLPPLSISDLTAYYVFTLEIFFCQPQADLCGERVSLKHETGHTLFLCSAVMCSREQVAGNVRKFFRKPPTASTAATNYQFHTD